MIRRYPAEDIHLLAELFGGHEEAYAMLIGRDRKELTLLLHYLVDENERSFEVLRETRHVVLAAFCKACDGERGSIKFLLEAKVPHWAAIANHINGDDAALAWLERAPEREYAVLARAIAARLKKEKDDNPFRDLFNAPI